MWDTTFQTAVAQAEVEDREVSGNFRGDSRECHGRLSGPSKPPRHEKEPSPVSLIHWNGIHKKNLFPYGPERPFRLTLPEAPQSGCR